MSIDLKVSSSSSVINKPPVSSKTGKDASNPKLDTEQDVLKISKSKDTKDKALDIAAATIAALTAKNFVLESSLANCMATMQALQSYSQPPQSPVAIILPTVLV